MPSSGFCIRKSNGKSRYPASIGPWFAIDPSWTTTPIWCMRWGGGQSSIGGRGGGAVRIFARNVTFADSSSGISANGTIAGGGSCCQRGGAGGSAWVVTDGFFGDGYIDVAFGDSSTNVSGKSNAGAVRVAYGSGSGIDSLDETWTQNSSGVEGTAGSGDRLGRPASGVADCGNSLPPLGCGDRQPRKPSAFSGVAQVEKGHGGLFPRTVSSRSPPPCAGGMRRPWGRSRSARHR